MGLAAAHDYAAAHEAGNSQQRPFSQTNERLVETKYAANQDVSITASTASRELKGEHSREAPPNCPSGAIFRPVGVPSFCFTARQALPDVRQLGAVVGSIFDLGQGKVS